MLRQRSVFTPLALTGALALCYRVIPAFGHLHKADAVVIAYMADDIASGRNFPLVHYGSQYMGALEAWLMAPVFYFFGPSWWGISVPTIIVSTLGIVPFYLLGSVYGGKRVGLSSALLWAIAPFAVNYYNITPRGPYPEVVVGGTLLLWYATQTLTAVKVSLRATFFYGLLMGLLLWTSLIAVPYVMVCALACIVAVRNGFSTKKAIALTLGALIGVCPAVGMIYSSFNSVGVVSSAPMGQRVSALLETGAELFIPYPAMEPDSIIVALGWGNLYIAVGSLVLLFFVPALERWSSPGATARASFWPLLLFTLLFLTAFLSNDRAMSQQSRYLLPLFTPFIIATAYFYNKLRMRIGAPALLLLLIPLCACVSNNWITFRAINRAGTAERKLIRQAAHDLNAVNVKSVIWVDYERSNLLNYEQYINAHPMAAMSWEGSRIARLTREAEADKDGGVILTSAPSQLMRQLESCCSVDYSVTNVSRWPMVYHMRPREQSTRSIPPGDWKLADNQSALGDRHFHTTYAGSGSFTIELTKPALLNRIRIIYGGRRPGPTALQVSVDGRKWTEVAPPLNPSIFVPYGPKVYVRTLNHYEREHQEWRFNPVMARFIRFDITNAPDHLFDIHELFVYRHTGGDPASSLPSEESLCALVNSEGVTILATDRWLTARMKPVCGDTISFALPSHEYTYDPMETSRWMISDGFSVLVRNEDSAELVARLTREGISYRRLKIGSLSLVRFSGPPRAVWWTGFTLINY